MDTSKRMVFRGSGVHACEHVNMKLQPRSRGVSSHVAECWTACQYCGWTNPAPPKYCWGDSPVNTNKPCFAMVSQWRERSSSTHNVAAKRHGLPNRWCVFDIVVCACGCVCVCLVMWESIQKESRHSSVPWTQRQHDTFILHLNLGAVDRPAKSLTSCW